MKNKCVFIKKFLLSALFCLFAAVGVFSIEEKDYKNMTDRDRILLSVSYYEVSLKYENLNNKALAQSYRSEALKIEKDVVKYYSGELEIPKKTIEIDWNSIFADETSDESAADADDDIADEEELSAEESADDDAYLDALLNDDTTEDNGAQKHSEEESAVQKSEQNAAQPQNSGAAHSAEKPAHDETAQSDDGTDKSAADIPQEAENAPQAYTDNIDDDDDTPWIPGQTTDNDPAIVLSQIVRGFIDGINDNDPDKAAKDFAETVTMQSRAFHLKKQELRDTIAAWCSEHDEPIPDSTDILIDGDESSGYDVTVLFDKDFDFFLPMSGKSLLLHVTSDNGVYQINEIKLKKNQSAEVSGDDLEYLNKLITVVLNGEFELLAPFIAKDVWINEFNMLFPASEIIDHFENWQLDNPDVASVEEVVDIASVTSDDDTAASLISALGIAETEYRIISFRLINTTFLPGNPSKDRYTLIVGRDGEADGQILGITQ